MNTPYIRAALRKTEPARREFSRRYSVPRHLDFISFQRLAKTALFSWKLIRETC